MVRLNEKGLTASELIKRDGRLDKFIDKVKSNSPFSLSQEASKKYNLHTVHVKSLMYKNEIFVTPTEIKKCVELYSGKPIYANVIDDMKKEYRIPMSAFEKTSEFGSVFSVNRGYVGELLFGVSVLSLFISDSTKQVTTSDLESILIDMKDVSTPTTLKYKSPVVDKQEYVNVEFIYKFPSNLVKNVKKMINDKSFVKEFNSIIVAVLSYVNHNQSIIEWRKSLYNHGDSSIKLSIVADGVTNAKNAKHDFSINLYDMFNNKTQDYVLLDTYKVSLKTENVSQFSQVGGNRIDSMQKLFKGLVTIPTNVLENSKENIINTAYKYVSEKVNSNKNPLFALDVLKYIKNHMTGDDNVDVIRLNKDATQYDFEKLKNYLVNNIKDMNCVFDTEGDVKLKFTFKEGVLFIIRYRLDGSSHRNVIEGRALLNTVMKGE